MKKEGSIFTKENIIKGLKWFFFSYIWLAILMFIIDIVSKNLVKANMSLSQSIDLIPNFLHITYVQNNGMAFGIDFNNKLANAIVFISVSVIGAIIIGVVMWKYWNKLGQVGRASMMLMMSGTIGNLIDRAFYVDKQGNHFVVDFIDFQFGSKHFPCFNIADSCLVVGTFMLLIYLVVMDIKYDREQKKKEAVMTQEEFEKNGDPNTIKVEVKSEVPSNEEQVETIVFDKPKDDKEIKEKENGKPKD